MKLVIEKIIIFVTVILLFSCKTPPSPDNDFDFNPKYNKPSIEINKALFFAVKNNDFNTVRDSLQKNAHPDVADMLGQSALMWATWNGNENIVRLLLEEKTRFFKKQKRRIPLFPSIVEANRYGYNAIHCAAFKDRVNIYQVLNKFYSNKWQSVVFSRDAAEETILHKAVKSGSYNMLNICLEEKNIGSIINNKNKHGYTPLHMAVLLNHSQMVSILLNRKADVLLGTDIPATDKKDDIITYPLVTAFEKRNYFIFCQLLENMTATYIDSITVQMDEEQILFYDYLQKIINDADDRQNIALKNEIERYFNSVSRRKEIPQRSAFDDVYISTLNNLYEAVKEGKKVDEIKRIVGSNKANIRDVDSLPILRKIELGDKKLIELALDNAVNSGNTDVLEYLLNNDVSYQPEALVYICKLGNSLDEPYLKTLSFMMRSIERYGIIIRHQESRSAGGKNALMYILDNDKLCDYLIENKQLFDILNKYLNGSAFNQIDLKNNDLRYYALKNKSKYRNEIFDEIFNNLIIREKDGTANDLPTPLFALEQNFFYAAEKIISNEIGFKNKKNYEMVSAKINQILSGGQQLEEEEKQMLQRSLDYIKNRQNNLLAQQDNKQNNQKKK